jgi:prephenate dehydrogenase
MKKAGIIGGTGRMGRLFAGVFRRAGYEVMVSGRSTKMTAHDIAQECDLVIVSVPIRDTVRVIEGIAPLLEKGQLLCDLTSLKAAPVASMLKSKAEVIGLHPMFGPTVRSLHQQTIIVCPARAEQARVDALLAVFRAEGAVCTITTPEDHDRMMAVVQGLTHFLTLCMADSVRRLGIDIDTTKAFTSPVYKIELSLVGRLLSQDPELYGSILQQNPFVPAVLAACRDSVCNLQEIIAEGDRDKFVRFFNDNTRHFGDYCTEGMETTDALIECLVNR